MISEVRSANGAKDLRVFAGSYEYFLFGWALNSTGKSRSTANDADGLRKVEKLFEYQAHVSVIRCIATNGMYLATGSDDEIVKIYNLKTKKEVALLDHHSDSITCISFYKDEYLFTSSLDGMISIIRIKDFALLDNLEGHKHGVAWFDIHPTGKALLSVSKNLTLRIWDLSRSTCNYSMRLENPTKKIFWSLTGDHYYLVYEDRVEIVDTAKGCVVKEILSGCVSTALVVLAKLEPNQTVPTELLLISETSGRITVYTAIGTQICAWNSNFTSRLKCIYAINHTANANSEVIACSSEGLIKLWDLSSAIRMTLTSPGADVPEHTCIKSGSRLTCIAGYR